MNKNKRRTLLELLTLSGGVQEILHRFFHFLRESFVKLWVERLEFVAELAQGGYLGVQIRGVRVLDGGSFAAIGGHAVQQVGAGLA